MKTPLAQTFLISLTVYWVIRNPQFWTDPTNSKIDITPESRSISDLSSTPNIQSDFDLPSVESTTWKAAYLEFMLAIVFLEVLILSSKYIGKIFVQDEPQLPTQKHEKEVSSSERSAIIEGNMSDQLKKSLLSVLKLIFEYSVCYIGCMIIFLVMSFCSNLYIRQEHMTQTGLPLTVATGRSLKEDENGIYTSTDQRMLDSPQTNLTGFLDYFEVEEGDTIVAMDYLPNQQIIYVAHKSNNSFLVLNVSDPRSITPMSSLELFSTSSYSANGLLVTPDQQTLFANVENGKTGTSALEIFNLTTAQQLSSIPINKVFCTALELHMERNVAFFVSTTSDKSSSHLLIIDISDLSQPIILSNTSLTHPYPPTCNLAVSSDGNTVFLSSSALLIYDVSKLSSPHLVGIYYRPGYTYYDVILSPDEQTAFLFAISSASSRPSLQIVNISQPSHSALISSLQLPQFFLPQTLSFTSFMAMSQDGNFIECPFDQGMVSLDVSNITSPRLLRVYNAYYPPYSLSSIALSSDQSTAFIAMSNLTAAINLMSSDMAYLSENNFLLGTSSTVNLNILQHNLSNILHYKFSSISLYQVQYQSTETDTDTDVIPIVSYLLSPNWIELDREAGTLRFAPNSSSQIGEYTLYATFSTAIDNTAFLKIGNITTPTQATDLMNELTVVGYLDNEGYITSEFDPKEKLVLSSKYSSDDLSDISFVLSKFYSTTNTFFTVSSSLNLIINTQWIFGPYIIINTNSPYPVNLHLSLILPSNADAHKRVAFINTNYHLTPAFESNQSALTLVGPITDINIAFSSLVIFLSDGLKACDGNMTVSDGLNPPLVQFVQNFSQFFMISFPPIVNVSHMQSQIANQSLKTGKQFTIQFDGTTFADERGLDLSLSLQMADNKTDVPDWLDIKDYTLTGTPPNQLFGWKLDLILTVSNEFQSTQAPFTLQVSVSEAYLHKLVVSCVLGTLLAAIGIYFSAPQVHNILAKNSYRYPKHFFIPVGQEITHNTIYPVTFIAEAKLESLLILERLIKKVNKQFQGRPKDELLSYFTDPETHRLDKDKLMKSIEDAAAEMLSTSNPKLKLYASDTKSQKELIDHLVANYITLKLLEHSQQASTKSAFKAVKKNIFALVSLEKCTEDGICKFSLDEEKLERELQVFKDKMLSIQKQRKTQSKSRNDYQKVPNSSIDLNASVTGEIPCETNEKDGPSHPINIKNIDLLMDAIKAHASNSQYLDVKATDVKVIIREKKPVKTDSPRFLLGFLKSDLQQITFTPQGQNIDSGLRFDIQNDRLEFSGLANSHIKGKTIVIQILNRRGKILREIWLAGVDFEPENEGLTVTTQK